jgi:hypothetical protein
LLAGGPGESHPLNLLIAQSSLARAAAVVHHDGVTST